MNIQEAKAHLTILKSDVLTGQELNSAIDFFEKFIDEVKEYKDTSIQWSIKDFKYQAEISNNYKLTTKREIIEYDESKFKAALHRMIDRHDANLGITWDTINIYLNEMCLEEE